MLLSMDAVYAAMQKLKANGVVGPYEVTIVVDGKPIELVVEEKGERAARLRAKEVATLAGTQLNSSQRAKLSSKRQRN